MSVTYTKSLSTDFGSSLDPNKLKNDLNSNVTITKTCYSVINTGDDVNILFSETLSGAEQTEMDTVCSNHTPRTFNETSGLYDAIIDSKFLGDYTSLAEAFSNNKSSVYIRTGTYIESSDIVLPNRGKIIGEAIGEVYIFLTNGAKIISDASSGNKETAGTISITHNTTTVTGSGTTFTNLNVGDFILISNNFYEIESITNNTSMELKDTFRGNTLSGESYMAQNMYSGINIENIIVLNSSGVGIYLRGIRHSVINSVAITGCSPNLQIIDSGDSSLQTIISSHGTGDGIEINNCYDILCTTGNIYNNTSNGVSIKGNSNCIIFESCTCTSNGNYGFSIEDTVNNTKLIDSIAKNNLSKGINTTINTNNIIINSCNILNNGGNGIELSGNTNIITSSICNNNQVNGISVDSESVIQGNQCKNNTTNGIYIINNDCTISGNRCINNTQDGIHSTGDDNVINSNICKNNTGNGIEITSTANNNIVTSNILTSNTGTNYVDSGTNTSSNNNIMT